MKVPHGGDIWNVARRLGLDPDEILDFSASVCPLGPAPLALKRLKDALNLLPAYPDPLAREFGNLFGAYLGLDPSNIIPGNGSTELLYMIPRVIRPGKALIVEPAFGEYARSLSLSGCRVEKFQCQEIDGFLIDTQRLIDRITEGEGFDVLYMANPANPTGVVTPLGDMLKILKACEERGTMFVVDEAFCDFVEEGSVKSLVTLSGSLVVLRSMTKFFSLAGLRLGAMIAPLDLVAKATEEMAPWSVNTLAMAAGAGSLKDKGHIKKVSVWFEDEYRFMEEVLSSIDGVTLFPSGANFFMLKVEGPPGVVTLLRDALIEDKILIRTLSEFSGLGDSFLRVAILKRKDNIFLAERLKAKLGELQMVK